MTEITLTPSQIVKSACSEFADAFGGVLRIKADAGATLGSAGLRSEIKADDATTVAEFCEAAKAAGLTAKVRTADDWVAVIDAFPLGAISKIGKNSNKAKMQSILDGLDKLPARPAEPKAETPRAPKQPALNVAPAPVEPAAKPKAEKEQSIKPHQKTSDLISQDEMNELLRKMDEMLATIKKLEARISALENNKSEENTTKTDSSNLKVVKTIFLYKRYLPIKNGYGIFNELKFVEWRFEKYKSDLSYFANDFRSGYVFNTRYIIDDTRYVLLSNGEVHLFYPMSDGDNLNIIRSIADQSGIQYKAQTKADKIAQEILKKYGSLGDSQVVIGKHIVFLQGRVCRIHDNVIDSGQADYVISDALAKLNGVKEMIAFKPQNLDLSDSMPVADKLQALKNYLDGVKFMDPTERDPKEEHARWLREYEEFKKGNLKS